MSNIKVKAQYLKDLSFEIPNAPEVSKKNSAQSESKLAVDINANKGSDNNEYEVTVEFYIQNAPAELVDLSFTLERLR